MAAKPVIFLAFANDRVDDAAYLRNLPKELHGIRAALDKAVRAGLCEVVERANTTIDDILNVFQDERYRDRIAIFHYGGHANGYQLLLETADGHHASAHSGGLVSFLAKQLGLKLVFLNGCSSQQQALDLVDEGISAVVGTSQSINDDVATALAVRFYSALGSGSELDRAWHEAIDQVKMQTGAAQGNMRDLFWEGDESDSVPDQFPWDIHYKNGAELVKNWNLPESVENPLFGLPEPAVQYDLPNQPYRFLQRYTREHAAIFFGRSYYIRDLYRSAIDQKTSPVILFYGQSGVGKSSMLDAGVFPRLERSHQVAYARRNQQTGLLGTLRMALGLEEGGLPVYAQQHQKEQQRLSEQLKQLEWLASQAEANVQGKIQEAIQALTDHAASKELNIQDLESSLGNDSSIKETWLTIEKEGGKPLIILLDQVEEVYTRPNPSMKTELEDFLDEVQGIFADVNNRPKGKLILSYRKEYHPEIKEACVMRAIPKEEIFLKALARKDIVEVIKGLTLNDRLLRQYRLQVEEELPVIIADDLLEDKDSPIAPVLQILLTKLWKMTEHEEHRLFSVSRYQDLRKQGILMDDFFHEQMVLLEKQFPQHVASGLALDVLHYHTTKLGTADSRSLDDLRERYSDRQRVVDELIEYFKGLYLLTDAGMDETGLAHDTLAPLVVNEFRHSDKPGQRGAIILENKLIAYEQNPEVVIDVDDLKVVEQGANGMRLWISQEQELIDKSRERRKKIEQAKKRNRRLAIVAMILIFFAAGFATQQALVAKMRSEEAKMEADNAKAAKELAEDEKNKADSARYEAVLQTIAADTAKAKAVRSAEIAELQRKLAELAQIEAEKQKQKVEEEQKATEEARKDAEVKAEEAIRQTKIAEEQTEIAKVETQKSAYQLLLSNARQVALKSTLMQGKDTVKALLALTAYDLQQDAHANYDRVALGLGKENSKEIFESLERSLKQFANDSLYAGESWSFSTSGENIVLSSERGKVLVGKLVPSKTNPLPNFQPIYDLSNLGNSKVYQTHFLPSGKILLASSAGEVLLATGNQVEKCYQHDHENILSLAYDDAYQEIYSAAEDKILRAWSITNKQDIWEIPTKAVVNALTIDEGKQTLYGIDEEGDFLQWNMTQKGTAPVEKVLATHPHPLRSMAYSAERQLLIAGCSHGEIVGYDLANGGKLRVFTGKHLGGVTSITFSHESRLLVSSSYDGRLLSWKFDDDTKLTDLYLQIPAVLENGRKIFSVAFTTDNKYILFSDRKALRARAAHPDLLHDELLKITKDRKLTAEEWKVYVGEEIEVPHGGE